LSIIHPWWGVAFLSFSWVEIAGHISFGLAALSFFVRDMILLRSLAIASGVVGVFFNYLVSFGPMWIPIMWLTVFICINSYRIIGIFLEKRSISFTDEELELYETVFQNFSSLEFMKLMRIAEWRSANIGYKFAEQGEVLTGLSLLFNGEVAIERNGKQLGLGRDGSMIGEMSFIKGGSANATVLANCECRYVYWPKGNLKALLTRNPSLDVAMKHVFSLDLTRKLVGDL
jgi:hypothetical protein